MLLLTREDIKKVFTMQHAIAADKEAFYLAAAGKAIIPLRTQIPVNKKDGTFVFMPAYAADRQCASLKIVNVFPGNTALGIPTTQGLVLLMDATTGSILAAMDGTYITQVRTGAASGAAFDLLACKDSKKGALFGTGGQAATQLEAMIVSRHPEEVLVYGRNAEHTTSFVKKMNKELQRYNTRITAAGTADEAVHDADIIICATTSNTPVFDGSKVKKGATISGVGSYQPQMQEMDSVLLQRADKIYVDSKEAVLAEAGDIITALQEGSIKETDITGELGELVAGTIPGRENDDEIIVFKTVGIGAQDLISAKFIYDLAAKTQVGTKWNE